MWSQNAPASVSEPNLGQADQREVVPPPNRGDRFYAVCRWLLVLVPTLVAPQLLTAQALWPPEPLSFALIAFGVYAFLVSLLALAGRLGGLGGLLLALDVIFLSMILFLFGSVGITYLYPLYFLPLLAAGLRRQALDGPLVSGASLIGYFAAALSQEANLSLDRLLSSDLFGVWFHGLVLLWVPVIANAFALRWRVDNQRTTILASREAEQARAEAQAARAETLAFYEIAAGLGQGSAETLAASLETSLKVAKASIGLVLLSTGEEDTLYVATERGLKPADAQRKIVVRGGLRDALQVDGPGAIEAISDEPDLAAFEGLRGQTGPAYVLPLRVRRQTYGLLVIVGNPKQLLDDQRVTQLMTIAACSILSLHNTQLEADLKLERKRAVDKELSVRQQISRDLHDGPAQSIAAMTMNIEFIRKLLDRDLPRASDELARLSTTSKRTNHEIRTMLFELRPMVIESEGLRATIRSYIDRIKPDAGGPLIVMDADGVEGVALEKQAETMLFNIIQEALNNALKHAQARHIKVELSREEHFLRTRILDDGRGFDKAAIMANYEQRGSFGLLNIDERARLVGGTATISSTPGKGTVVTVLVPMEG